MNAISPLTTALEIPQEHASLYHDYLKRVDSLKKVETIMWVVYDNGHKVGMIDKDVHKAHVRALLTSGDSRKEHVAGEVMSRTLGIWRSR